MISLYTGTGGSSKSYHVARDIYRTLTSKRNVIATFPVNLDFIRGAVRNRKGEIKRYRRKIGDFAHRPYNMLTVEFLVAYAEIKHKKGIEGQTLLVIDECQIMFDPRTIKHDRAKWILFMCLHRHYGYDIVLVTQHKRLIDRQIRDQCEYEVKHRCLNNNGLIGMCLPFKLFTSVRLWNDIRADYDVYMLRKRYFRIYDSYTEIQPDHMLLIADDYNQALEELKKNQG